MKRKKILIVNDNLHLGGIQKSLINFLNATHEHYDITLMLFWGGELENAVPDGIKIRYVCKSLSVLGAHKSDLKGNLFLYLWKAVLIIIARCFSKKSAFSFASIFQHNVEGFDVAISFSHPSKNHNLASCSAELVLDKVSSKEKICFVHCDCKNDANRCDYTTQVYSRFDKIACCSNSVRNVFLETVPIDSSKVFSVRNFYDLSLCQIIKSECFMYDERYINIVTVARLSEEKGIRRAIEALCESGRKDIRYYIVGDGPETADIVNLIHTNGLRDYVFLMGACINPHYYIKNADYLLVSSFHEAAPMVFDESILLNTPVITTETTSAMEMIGEKWGIVCGNTKESLTFTFTNLKKGENLKNKIHHTNELQYEQLSKLID